MARAQSIVAGRFPRAKESARLSVLSPENAVLFTASLGIYLVLALRLQYLDIFFGDAVSRTASAFFVLFSRDPHLGAIGFIWNPLPAALQLPLVAALHLVRADVLLAGNLMSAACGAATLVVLNIAMRRAGLRAGLRWPLIALYTLNPMIMLYSANGMSEAAFILFTVLAVVSFMWWSESDSLFAFTLMAVAVALALWTRYEALALTAAIAFCLVPINWPLARYLGIDLVAERIEAHLAAFLAVALYSFGLWMYFNWMMMGNPVYFLQSVYGNLSQTAEFTSGGVTYLSPAIGSVRGSLLYGVHQSLWLFPTFGVLALLALLLAIRRRHMVLTCIQLISLAIPVFEVALIYRASSFGWLRFFMYGIPFSYLLLIGLWSAAPELFRGRPGVITWTAIFSALLLSNVASWFAMNNPDIGREEWIVTRKLVDPSQPSLLYSLADARELAEYIAQFPPNEKVLMEIVAGYAIPPLSPDPTRYVVTSDQDFEQVVKQPYGNVTYILLPKPEGLGANDRINLEYPGLWESGATWAELVKEFKHTRHGWKLYRVIGTPAAS